MDIQAFPSPCFILELDKLKQNLGVLHKLSTALDLKILLALKGFACYPLFDSLAPPLQGAAVGSLYEARLVYEEMNLKAHAYAPAFRADQWTEWLGYLSHVSFNSLAQYEHYAPLAHQAGISCGLRIQPGLGIAPKDIYNPCAKASRFGVSAKALSQHAQPIPHLEGMHLHALCEADSHAFERVLRTTDKQFGRYFSKLKWLNFGGGHLLTDTSYDLAHLSRLLCTFKESYPQLTLFIEPSSAVLWQCGVLASTIIDIITQDEIQTAILDISFSCHLPDCLEMPYRPLVRGATAEPLPNAPHRYRLGGLSCLAGDYLEAYGFAHALRVGDQLVFEDMMHYTMVKGTSFNGLQRPAFGTWSSSKGALLCSRWGYDNYRNYVA